MVRVRRLILAIVLATGWSWRPSAARRPPRTSDEESTEPEINVLVLDRQGTRERDDDEPVEGAIIVVTDAAGERGRRGRDRRRGPRHHRPAGRGSVHRHPRPRLPRRRRGLPREGGDVIAIDPNRSRVLNITVGDRERASTTTVDRLPQVIFNGLSFGLIIAICSVGLSLIFGTTGLVNFAHGEHRSPGAPSSPGGSTRDHGMQLVPAASSPILIGAAHRRRHRPGPLEAAAYARRCASSP